MKKLSKKTTIANAKKLVQKMNRETKKANAAFEKLTPADKRVYIARDVLAQLKSGKIIATSGIWVSNPNGSGIIPDKAVKEDVELKSVFDKLKSCKACALGGLFVSAVRISDKLKISEMDHMKSGQCFLSENGEDQADDFGKVMASRTVFFNDVTKYLGRFFSKQQLRLIEIAFEQGEGGVEPDLIDYDENAASKFFIEYFDLTESMPEDDECMRLIMENIIVNNGRFVPSKSPKFALVTTGFTG